MAITGYMLLTDKYVQEFIADVLVSLAHLTASVGIFMTFHLEPLDYYDEVLQTADLSSSALGCIKHMSANADMITYVLKLKNFHNCVLHCSH